MKTTFAVLLAASLGCAAMAGGAYKSLDLHVHYHEVVHNGNYQTVVGHLQSLPYMSYWLFVVSFMSLFGTLQAFFSTTLLRQYQFNKAQHEVTPLAGRLFGCWTTLATLLRVCCAWDPSNVTVYRLTICTFILAMSIYAHAFLVARSISLRNVMMPMVFALPSFIWMVYFPPTF